MAKSNGKGSKGGEKKEAPRDQRVEDFDRDLRVILTTTEVAERADRAAHLIAQRDSRADMAKAAAKHAKSEIDELEATIRRLSGEVRDKACYQATACARTFDYQAGKVIETRKDTGEVISERAMTPEERQMSFEPKKPGDGDGPQGGGGGGLDDDFEEHPEAP